MNILITGINGFLGSNLAKALYKKHSIIGLEYSTEKLQRLEGYDIRVYSSIHNNFETIFRENCIDIIIHTATIYRNQNSSIENLIQTNIILPAKLYELSHEWGVKAFINTDSFFNNPDYEYSYLGEYTLSKKHCLEWLKALNGKTRLINMKLFHMYGPDDSKNKFVMKILADLKNHKREIKLTSGEQARDFIYISDVVSAYEVVINNIHSIDKRFIEFQVGTGILTSIRDFVETAAKVTNSKSLLLFGALPYRKGEIMSAVADTAALKSINWQPEQTLKKGLDETSRQL